MSEEARKQQQKAAENKAVGDGLRREVENIEKALSDLSSGTVGPPGAGGQQVSTNMTVAMDNRLKVLICLRHGADPAKVAAALGLGPYGVIAMTATGTILLAPGDPQALAAKAQGHPDVCFVETNYCMIMTPLTAFRGHVHELHRGRLHDHDAPDPPWSWSLTPPEPVVSWGGQ